MGGEPNVQILKAEELVEAPILEKTLEPLRVRPTTHRFGFGGWGVGFGVQCVGFGVYLELGFGGWRDSLT